MPCKVLILYITKRSGHHCAAIALEKAFKKNFPDIEINIVDAFKYTNPILNKIAHKTYMQLIRSNPDVWEYLYDNPGIVRRSQKLKRLIHKYNSRKLLSLLGEFNPDLVICTQAFPCGMVADLKKYRNMNLPIVGVLTDYVAHSFWFYDNVDLYVVPDESTKKRMIKSGIVEGKVRVHGIPIAPEFNVEVDKKTIYEKFNLNPDLTTILIMGGGRGLGQIKEMVFSLCKINKEFQMIVICGVNKKLSKYLKKKSKKINRMKRFSVLEYASNIYEIMSISDILISKPGGITTAEALAKNLPMIIFNPLPGQEKSNAEFLLNIGTAIRCDNISDLRILTSDLLENKNKLTVMAQSADASKHPNSAIEIVSDAISLFLNHG